MNDRPDNAPRLDHQLERACIQWDGEFDRDGYGRSGNGRTRSQQAHRAVWEEDVADIPEGMTLDHICHNRWCIATYHLELVTQSENSKRRHGVGDIPIGQA